MECPFSLSKFPYYHFVSGACSYLDRLNPSVSAAQCEPAKKAIRRRCADRLFDDEVNKNEGEGEEGAESSRS